MTRVMMTTLRTSTTSMTSMRTRTNGSSRRASSRRRPTTRVVNDDDADADAVGTTTRRTYRLIMLRHSAAMPQSDTEKDADRALSVEGRALAAGVGRAASESGWTPDLTLCSASRRSRETLEVMRRENPAFGGEGRTIYLGSLYHFASLDGQYRHHLTECVARETCPPEEAACARIPEARTIMAVGHNKGMEEAVTELCGEEVRLLTATAALLERVIDTAEETWERAMSVAGGWRLVAIATPTGVIRR